MKTLLLTIRRFLIQHKLKNWIDRKRISEFYVSTRRNVTELAKTLNRKKHAQPDSFVGLDTNIPKNALKVYREILTFSPKNPSKNL